MDDQLLDLLAKNLFKNVKRRRLSEDEKRRLRNVTDEIQNQLDELTATMADLTRAKSTRTDETKTPRRRLTWRRND